MWSKLLQFLVIAACGRAGDGSLTSLSTFAWISRMMRRYLHMQRFVESNIKTEPTKMGLLLASRAVSCLSDFYDILIAFDQSAIEDEEGEGRELPIAQARPGGIVIYDSSPRLEYPNNGHELNIAAAKRIIDRNELALFGVPMAELVVQRFGRNAYIARNSVPIGILAELFNIPDEVCRAEFAKEHTKPEALEWNLGAYEMGRHYAREKGWKVPAHVAYPDAGLVTAEDQLCVGGDAVGLGALMAGNRAYFGYPITPASEVLEYMAKNMPTSGLVAMVVREDATLEELEEARRIRETCGANIQEMSEIMAINALSGASIAGARAMTGTSGPGFSLMTEGESGMGASETPAVIMLAQRGGPGTGLPTRTGQEDLLFSIFSGHGEFPKIVISPKDATEAMYFAALSHNLAERYQTPVILLTEQTVTQGLFLAPPFDPLRISIDRGKVVSQGMLDALRAAGLPYLRYALTDDGISPRAFPGMRYGEHLASTNEHDELGRASETVANRIAMTRKRMRKLELAARDSDLPQPMVMHNDSVEVGFVTFGYPTNATREAALALREHGVSAAVMQVRTIWPFPDAAVRQFMERCAKVYVVEQNYTGQLQQLVQMKVCGPSKKLSGIRRYDGRPITPEDVLRGVVEGGTSA